MELALPEHATVMEWRTVGTATAQHLRLVGESIFSSHNKFCLLVKCITLRHIELCIPMECITSRQILPSGDINYL